MPRTEIAKHTINVTESLRELLDMIGFPEIPESAKYIAFLDDGEAVYLEDIASPDGMFMLFPKTKFVALMYHTDVQVTLDD